MGPFKANALDAVAETAGGKMNITDTDRYCKKCGADWLGQEIPEKDRESFGNHTNFSRRISMYDRDLDRTVAYKCPDCGDISLR